MHSPLENYLSEIAIHLGPLPEKRRAEELREMRAHLENAIIVNRERGQTEDEAVRAALTQFGVPEMVGQSTVTGYWRGEALNTRSIWVTAAWSYGVMAVLTPLFNLLAMAYFKQFNSANEPGWLQNYSLSFVIAVPILIGCGIGLLFPKKAVVGTRYAAIARCVVGVASLSYWFIPAFRGSSHISLMSVVSSWACQTILCGFLTLLGAWAGSRWRERYGRLARG